MDYQIEEVVGKNNFITLKVNGYFLHSKYNPLDEAKKFVEKHYESYSSHILIGYGKGYIVDTFLNSFQHDERILIIDPLVEQGLIKVKADHQINDRISFFKTSEMKYFTSFLKRNENVINQMEYQICCSPNYDKLFEELHVEVYRKVKELLHSNILRINTTNLSAENWLINTIYSLGNLCKDVNLNELIDVYDAPVVVASGGPSLTKHLELLKEIRENIILIAAGSTLNSLLKVGIEPDYVVIVDGNDINERHYGHLRLNNTELIYSPEVYRGVRKSFNLSGYCFVHRNDEQFKRIIHQKFNSDLPIILGGGTVAHYSLSIATYISKGPIALIGQDLAYTNLQSHADGNVNLNQIIDINSKKYLYTDGYYGDKVLTDISFYDMKKDFERLIDLLNIEDRVVNCTEGGVCLEGYEQIPFKQFIEKYITNQKISKEKVTAKPVSDVEKMIAYTISFLRDFESIKKEISTGEGLLKNKKTIDNQLLKKIKKINKKLSLFIDEYPLDRGFEQLGSEGSRVFTGHKLEGDEAEQIINFTVSFYNRCLQLYDLLTPHLKIVIEDLEKRVQHGDY